MGLLKKVKKAVKSVTKAVIPGSSAVDKLLGDDEKKPAAVIEAPATVAAPAPAAAVVEAPKGDADSEDDADTESAKKAARARGKRGLQVARSAGTGINI